MAVTLAGAFLAHATCARASTIPLKAEVVEIESPYEEGKRCSEKTILQIVVPANVKSYKASVEQIGYMTFEFSGPPFTDPIEGFGNPYTPPSGDAAWFLGGDSGPSPCEEARGFYRNPMATGELASGSASAGGGSSGGGGGAAACIVPNLIDHTLGAAKRALARDHCRLGTVSHRVDGALAGLVITQRPRKGRHLPAGSKVAVVIGAR